ncbi:LacI family DNA-binding transcriptional regulator [Fictibacillus fluitans]|uniref:LacI family DNA-binding transcriptional regulator n=1 Tax=Fictibacillus fluitans TaxID=3058422 RepID=A0ABT8HWN4_9BACL|nr:LacI family DNA-binding transcriptional regulator [Fictibacillus sp. NE201]MDN4525181.1 LacI family DNA-binding transcriptional regulator [Fictibacillus sp. NE201]
MKDTITMQDIANKLNVSKALVSKALSNKPGVSAKTKEKIRVVAMELGYSLTPAKQTVSLSQTDNVAVLLPRKFHEDLEYWGIVLQGIEIELQRYGYSMIVSTIDLEESSVGQLPTCIENRKVDGALILGNIPSSVVSGVQMYGTPIILVDSLNMSSQFDHVLTQNFGGTYEATKLMLNNGFKRLAFVGDQSFSWSFSERLRGYQAAITEWNNLHPNTVSSQILTGIGGDYVSEGFEEELIKYLSKDSNPGLVAANDPIALNCLKTAEEHDYKCPEDFSLIGFDNIAKAKWNELTTVDVDKNGIGKTAVELLLKRLQEENRRTVQVMLSTSIVHRNTVNYLSDH